MKHLSLRFQIFLTVTLTVLAVGAASFRSTWAFLFQDKLASLRELQTLSLLATLQDVRSQAQDLREDLRAIAVDKYQSPDLIGKVFRDVNSKHGAWVWSELELRSDKESLRAPSSSAGKSPISLLFDTTNPPVAKNASSALANARASYRVVEEAGRSYLLVEDPLVLGPERTPYILRGKVPASVLLDPLRSLRFRSIEVQLYFRSSPNASLSPLADQTILLGDVYRERIQAELGSRALDAVDGRSIAMEHDDRKSFISFSGLRIPQVESNLVVAFVSEESRLVAEFQAFVVEQLFLLLAILGGALLLSFSLTRLITRPLSELVLATHELEKGNFANRVSVDTRNEIGSLATAFNHLGQTLLQREEALESANRNMRQLSFQADVFKRLTQFSERISSILDPVVQSKAIVDSLFDVFQLPVESNFVAFYRYDAEASRFVRSVGVNDADAGLPQSVGPELWEGTSEYGPDTMILSEGKRKVLRMPITGESQVFGVLVFSFEGGELGSSNDMLMVECQKLVSASYEAASRYASLRETSIRDGLTGLFNVRFFKECFEKELKARETTRTPTSFLFFDVDHFKKYNDTHGHPAGDRVLKQIASLMRASFDTTDIVARYGGEEFVVLLKETSHEEGMRKAERFREAVEKAVFENEHTQPLGRLTVSIGVSSFPEHGEDMATIIKAADDALYQAKKTSRNLVISANALKKSDDTAAA